MAGEQAQPSDLRLRRRDAIVLLGGLVAGAAWNLSCGSKERRGAAAASSPSASSAAACVLTPEVTEGPYYIANHLKRRDVTGSRPGLALALRLLVQDAASCKPIKGATVEIWHADAGGHYSGVDDSKTYLRGYQKTDARGRARFDTIYPGWYMGRTPHIHVKVHVGGHEVHTGQLFFADSASAAVYRKRPYRARGQSETRNGDDMIYADAGGAKARLKLHRRARRKGYLGTAALGVKT